MKDRILKILKESDDYISGQSICDSLNVSRTAVWKGINSLRDAGYEIEAVKNRGYRLKEAPDVMYEQELRSVLKTEWFGKRILYFDSIDSTNSEIKRQAELKTEHGLLAVAEEQTAGKGRRGHSWISPPGTGIWFSFMVTPDISPDKVSMLTLVAALAIASGIRETTGLKTSIKWPNDIIVNGKKVCGILTELSAELSMVNYVVIGIGINANTESFPDEIKDMATSLFIESGKKVRRVNIIEAVGRNFENYYSMFMKAGNLSLLKEEYNDMLVNKGRQVKVVDKDGEMVYTAIGIDDGGSLLVKDDEGNIHGIISGEVSVRGLYGYV